MSLYNKCRNRWVYKRDQRRGVRLVLLTLALIVFVRFDAGPSDRLVREMRSQGPTGLKLANGARITMASAAYLDSIGQLTNVMNEFINSLLEKVSFLAEIVIESSLDEECPSPFLRETTTTTTTTTMGPVEYQSPSKYTGTGTGTGTGVSDKNLSFKQVAGERVRLRQTLINVSACRQYEQRHNLTRLANNYKTLNRDNFDESEFKDIDTFLSGYLGNVASKPLANMANNLTLTRGVGCKLFTFDLQPDDLPADDMGLCCYQFNNCYSICGRTKHECDKQFRACLNGICKANFNYKNETLVRAFQATRAHSQQAAGTGTGATAARFGKRNVELDNDKLENDDEEDKEEDELNLGYEPIAEPSESKIDDDDELEPEQASDEIRDESTQVGVRTIRQAIVPEANQLARKDRPGGTGSEKLQPEASGAKEDGILVGGEGEERDQEGGSNERRAQGEAGEEMDARSIKTMRDKYKACKLASKLLIIGNLAFGCQNYRQAQWRACCV